MDLLKFRDKIYTKEDLSTALKGLGVSKENVVLAHIESFVFGIPLLSKEAFNTALCEVLKDSCQTLIIPTFSYSFCENKIFDIRQSRSKAGDLGFYLMKLGGSRTHCPIFSCAIYGKTQNEFVEKSKICKEVLGKNSIFELLLAHNGKILTFGNQNVGYTFVHFLESLANVPYRFDKVFSGIIIDENGKQSQKDVIYKVRHLDRKSELDYKKIASFLRDLGILKVMKFAGGEVGIMESQKVAEAILEIFKKDSNYFLL